MATYESTVVQKPGEYVLDAFQPPNAPSVVVSEGPQGPPGPPGSGFQHHQTVPAASWPIEHNLGSKPDVTVVLDDWPTERVYTDIQYPDNNNLVVELPSPATGWAYM